MPVENLRAGWAITDDLERVAAGRRIGSMAVPLYSSEDIEQGALEESKILAASGGKLPVIYVSFDVFGGLSVIQEAVSRRLRREWKG